VAEPALDLGEFIAHLAVAGARGAPAGSRRSGDDLEGVFLREYLRRSHESDAHALLTRVAAYRTLALTSLALRSWSRFRPERLSHVLALFDAEQRTYAV
jgi:hypothetical protein